MSSNNRPWPPQAVSQKRVEQRQLYQVVENFDGPSEVQIALSRFLVIRTAGYVESVRDELASAHAERTAAPRVHHRVRQSLSSGLGVKPKQLEDFLGSFDREWRSTFSNRIDAGDMRLRNNLGALVSDRGKIAHGHGEQVTIRKALTWADSAEEIVEMLITIMDPG